MAASQKGTSVKIRWTKLVKTATMNTYFVALIVAPRYVYLGEQGNFHPVAKRQLFTRYGHMPFGSTRGFNTFLENWAIPVEARADAAETPQSFFNRSEYAADEPKRA